MSFRVDNKKKPNKSNKLSVLLLTVLEDAGKLRYMREVLFMAGTSGFYGFQFKASRKNRKRLVFYDNFIYSQIYTRKISIFLNLENFSSQKTCSAGG